MIQLSFLGGRLEKRTEKQEREAENTVTFILYNFIKIK